MTLPAGFAAHGVAAGIKSRGLDLALVSAFEPVPTAAVFTRSATPAAPVILSRHHVDDGRARAVVLSSGCANAATGDEGMVDARRMAAAVGSELGVDSTDVLVCSTGVIGTRLPIERIERSVPGLVEGLSEDGMNRAAEAIMTTDRVPKVATTPGPVAIVGIAKGAGMIRPDMATMLSVVVTDAATDQANLSTALRRAVDQTFNALSVDGAMSTNDTVVAMASGRGEPVDEDLLAEGITSVCRDLARQIAADGEGATRQIDIEVRGAESDNEARRAGLAVADSALVRSSFAAGDPNWGRVIAALGAAGISPSGVSVAYAGTVVARDGVSTGVDAAHLRGDLTADFLVEVTLGPGNGRAVVHTCDLTPDYVIENMETS